MVSDENENEPLIIANVDNLAITRKRWKASIPFYYFWKLRNKRPIEASITIDTLTIHPKKKFVHRCFIPLASLGV